MLVVKDIKVFTLDRDSLTISWSLESSVADPSLYTVAVLRSSSEAGPYSVLSSELGAGSINSYEDTSVNLHSRFREYFYRVRATETATGSTQTYGSAPLQAIVSGEEPGSVFLEAFPDLEALEAIRRFDLVAKEYAGRRVLVLTNRSEGTHCTNCWDLLKRRRKFSNCATCYGTGRTSGYFSPAECYAVKPPGKEVAALTPLFELQPNDAVMWFSSTPRLSPRDLVIDADGRRWRVLQVEKSEKLWALTRQTAQLREITKDQVEYDVPISWRQLPL